MDHLIDCHLHLQAPRFEPDRESVLTRALQSGVRRLVCNGTCEYDWPMVAKLAKDHAEIIPCFGLHPWYVGGRSADWLTSLETFLDNQPSGVGEIGLDRWIQDRDEAAQEDAFRVQLALAKEKRRPVMIHCLRAWDQLMAVLRSDGLLPAGMLIHAYGGSADLVGELVKMGAYFSFAGSVLEEKRTKAREALLAVPKDRLLLETDSPDLLPPAGYRLTDERNEPANLGEILRGVATILNETPEALAQTVWTNSERFFGGIRNHDRI
jgi:TatD DNase family protein